LLASPRRSCGRTFEVRFAFGVYLPTYLKTVYGLATTDAAARAAGFVLLATLARPVGGWLADRVGGVRVLEWALGVGSVTGVVGAAGGLGGFLPPIVMGLVFQATGSYAIGLMLLLDVALAGLVFTVLRLGPAARTSG
jgi:MFS transporter, NNP family, nitrate/nitrite transporter